MTGPGGAGRRAGTGGRNRVPPCGWRGRWGRRGGSGGAAVGVAAPLEQAANTSIATVEAESSDNRLGRRSIAFVFLLTTPLPTHGGTPLEVADLRPSHRSSTMARPPATSILPTVCEDRPSCTTQEPRPRAGGGSLAPAVRRMPPSTLDPWSVCALAWSSWRPGSAWSTRTSSVTWRPSTRRAAAGRPGRLPRARPDRLPAPGPQRGRGHAPRRSAAAPARRRDARHLRRGQLRGGVRTTTASSSAPRCWRTASCATSTARSSCPTTASSTSGASSRRAR